MMLAEQYLSRATETPFAVSGRHPEVLAGVRRAGTALAIWHRRPLASEVLQPLLDAAPFCAVAEDGFDQVAAGVAEQLPVPPPPALARDLGSLAALFAALLGHGRVRLRLEGITGDACRRFHVDAVRLRLLCTYAGAGTEWLPLPGGAAAARDLDAETDHAPSRLPAGAVALLKGEGWPGNRGGGCIHRSPPMHGRRAPRLLLCLDEPGRIPVP